MNEQTTIACFTLLLDINQLQSQLQARYQDLLTLLHEAGYSEQQAELKPQTYLVRVK